MKSHAEEEDNFTGSHFTDGQKLVSSQLALGHRVTGTQYPHFWEGCSSQPGLGWHASKQTRNHSAPESATMRPLSSDMAGPSARLLGWRYSTRTMGGHCHPGSPCSTFCWLINDALLRRTSFGLGPSPHLSCSSSSADLGPLPSHRSSDCCAHPSLLPLQDMQARRLFLRAQCRGASKSQCLIVLVLNRSSLRPPRADPARFAWCVLRGGARKCNSCLRRSSHGPEPRTGTWRWRRTSSSRAASTSLCLSGPSTPLSRGLSNATVSINCPPTQAGQAPLFKSPSVCSASMWQRCRILVSGTFRHCVLPFVLCRSRAYPLRLTCPILLRCGKELPVLPAQPTPGWQSQGSASQTHTQVNACRLMPPLLLLPGHPYYRPRDQLTSTSWSFSQFAERLQYHPQL